MQIIALAFLLFQSTSNTDTNVSALHPHPEIQIDGSIVHSFEYYRPKGLWALATTSRASKNSIHEIIFAHSRSNIKPVHLKEYSYIGGFSADGSKLLTYTSRSRCAIWDTKTCKETGGVCIFVQRNYQAKISPNGVDIAEIVVLPDYGSYLNVGISNKTSKDFGFATSIQAFSPDGKLLVTTASGRYDETYVLDLSTKRVIHRFKVDSAVKKAVFSESGKYLAVGRSNGVVEVIIWPEKKPVATFNVGKRAISGLAFSQDGNTVAACDGSGNITVYSLKSGKQLRFSGAQSSEGSVALVGAGTDIRVFFTYKGGLHSIAVGTGF